VATKSFRGAAVKSARMKMSRAESFVIRSSSFRAAN